MGYYDSFDVVVVGAGHAGLESAMAASNMGCKTLIITQTIDTIGRMSCNPSIGGIAKGNIVREIDALGGVMAKLTDASMIQYRLLNKSRGPAVIAPRAQADKLLYAQNARKMLEQQKNLYTLMDEVVSINAVESNTPMPPNSDSAADVGTIPGESRSTDKSPMRKKIVSITTKRGRVVPTRAVVLTTGTFLGGRIFIGSFDAQCGRLGEVAALGLTASLHNLGFTTGRLKTGTPPRVLKKTIDFSKLEESPGDNEVIPFSFSDNAPGLLHIHNKEDQNLCHVVYTNPDTHKIIKDNISRSPLYSGKITGVGPRYCPSIEDKVMRFSNRYRHQIFVEPEGRETDEMYLNGLSSSLPEEVQDAFMHTMSGFENAVQSRPGYAVEYDYVEPTQLFPSLETKRVAGLFNAGQINGTSGYEEAAGQGLVAGINAAYFSKADKSRCVKTSTSDTSPTQENFNNTSEIATIAEYEPLILKRDEAYIGVLIDDLVTLGTREPYRMFTARAEYRLKLRADTADLRMAPHALRAGLKTKEEVDAITKKYAIINEITERLIKEGFSNTTNETVTPPAWVSEYPKSLADMALIDSKYYYYIKKQDARISKMHKMESVHIPNNFNYNAIKSLSAESRGKLEKVRPATLGQASRISGIRMSDIMLLMVYLR